MQRARNIDFAEIMAAVLTDLLQLNASSAKVATFHVKVLYPQRLEYQYTDKSGSKKTGLLFNCRLVSEGPHSVEANFRGSATDIKTVEDKYKHGHTFLLSKATLDSKTPACFIASSIKMSVDLKTSSLVLCPDEKGILAATIASPYDIKDLLEVSSRMAFDLVAFLASVSEDRKVDLKAGGTAYVCDLVFTDGSQKEGKELALTVGCWNPTLAQHLRSLQKQVVSILCPVCNLHLFLPHPDKVIMSCETLDFMHSRPLLAIFLMCCRSLRANVVGGHLRFNTSDTTQVEASKDLLKQTDRGSDVLAKEGDLSLQKGDQETLGATGVASLPFDVTTEPSTLTACALLEAMAGNSMLGNEQPWIFQVNACFVHPPTSEVLTKKGDRLWFLCEVLDITGSTTLGFSEEAALQLSGCMDKETFLATFEAKDLVFPMLSNLRVVRTVRKIEGLDVVNNVVVQAGELNLASVTDSKVMEHVLKLVQQCAPCADAIVPAKLSEIERSPHYGLQIKLEKAKPRTARQVLCLLESRTRSETVQVGEGYAVKTSITDCFAGDTEKYEVQGYCMLNRVTDYKLDPPRGTNGRSKVVLALITNKLTDKTFLADQFWQLDDSQIESAKAAFQQLRTWAAQVHGTSSAPKRAVRFSEDSPLDVKKARTLAAYPSDPPLP